MSQKHALLNAKVITCYAHFRHVMSPSNSYFLIRYYALIQLNLQAFFSGINKKKGISI